MQPKTLEAPHWPEGKGEPGDSYTPHPRDILRWEHDELAKKPRNVALEKHGASIEAQIERDLRDREPDLDMG
jgi:hypothetical protein